MNLVLFVAAVVFMVFSGVCFERTNSITAVICLLIGIFLALAVVGSASISCGG